MVLARKCVTTGSALSPTETCGLLALAQGQVIVFRTLRSDLIATAAEQLEVLR